MMDIPEELKEYFDDSSLLLVSAKDLKDYDFKDRDNKQLFSLIHDFFYNKEKDVTEILRPYMGENIRRITLLTVGVIVGAEQLIEYALEGEKEEIDMCEAVRRWEKKIAERERADKTYTFINNIIKSTGKRIEEACDMVGITVAEYEAAIATLSTEQEDKEQDEKE